MLPDGGYFQLLSGHIFNISLFLQLNATLLPTYPLVYHSVGVKHWRRGFGAGEGG